MQKVKKDGKRLSVERIYQKKTQLEHILLRPDTYIGSVEQVTQQMWVFDEELGMNCRDVTYVPGLYKIFDEILGEFANCICSSWCLSLFFLDWENTTISVWNNGKGIPVVEHKVEKVFVPALIFGQLLTSSNYDDEQKKVTGGRNGYGAKLCNIFSTKFTVETACREFKKTFKQSWYENMARAGESKIRPFEGEDFTCITFQPDLPKFKMETLDRDIVALMSRRAYDIAGVSQGVKVFLNGKRLPVSGFRSYVDLYLKDKLDETGSPLKVVHEAVSDRWEVCLTMSEKGFQQISFVNSIATTKGGRHVDYVADQIVTKLIEVVKRKNKAGVAVKPFQVKNHMWVFVNSLIENPTFDSQTKENMTLQHKSFGSSCAMSDKFIKAHKSFGSSCAMSDKFIKAANSCGIVESVMNWVRFKAQSQLNKKCSSVKHTKIKGVPKLDDANDAGGKNSSGCTLILTEGDSAKTLAVSGLGVVGRDRYGVFPLRGKMLNVREATHKQIMENTEINNIIKIMGLQYKKNYAEPDSLKTLRYGKIMIMTDQVSSTDRAAAPRDVETLSPYEVHHGGPHGCLGTSTSKEAKEYFADMERHRIAFRYAGPEDDAAIALAFSKKMVDDRKEWLTNFMEGRRQRRLHGLPEDFLYGQATKHLTYNDFINKELVLFSNSDNERSIPSVVDGLKPGQRKVLFTCFKRNDKREVKVAQLAGSVAEMSAYHHGELSLMMTIINLAQNFVGSNNLNLLQPVGQFGTRLHGGKDAASPRYIFTMLSPLARLLFPAVDDNLLKNTYDDNQKVEPEWYVPIIPTVLLNGAEGIGTGWACRIPNFDVREVVNNMRRMLEGEEPLPMLPSYKTFKGTVQELGPNQYLISGEISVLDSTSIEISELPAKTWTQEEEEGEEGDEPLASGPDYNYLLNMPLWYLTKEKKEELCKQRDAKMTELSTLKRKSPLDLWKEDLAAFVEELEPLKGKAGKPKAVKLIQQETMPSPQGRRVVPRVTTAMKADASKKVKKRVKGEDGVVMKMEFEESGAGDNLAQNSPERGESLATRLTKKSQKETGAQGGAKGKKQMTLPFKPVKKEKRNPWSDSSEPELSDSEAAPRERVPRRAADQDSEEGEAVQSKHSAPPAKPVAQKEKAAGKKTLGKKPTSSTTVKKKGGSDDKQPSILDALTKPKAPAPKTSRSTAAAGPSSSSDSEPKRSKATSAAVKKPKAARKRESSGSEESGCDLMSRIKGKPAANKKAKTYADDESFKLQSGSESDTVAPSSRPGRAKKVKAKTYADDESFKLQSGSESDTVAPSSRPGRAKKVVQYLASDSDSDFGF
ncbi:UNVERIFIED_CONTAM: hypothetical protein FKN15_071314 [Acipenser sinensis]